MTEAPTTPSSVFKNRIVGFDPAVNAEELLANPANWRIHPRAQRQALESVLEQVGFVAPAIVNVTTGHLVDGHMRAESAISKGETIPVAYVELSPEEEATILASFDPIGDLAKQDDAQLRPLLEAMSQNHGELHKLLTDAKDFGGAVGDGSERGDGSMLKLVDVTIGEPQHQVREGDVWRIGPHVLHCASPVGFPTWLTALGAWTTQHGDLAVFAPYPGPLVPTTVKAGTHRLFMVQPDPYVAGHILDRAADVYGGEAIEQLERGDAPQPSDEELQPTYRGPRRKKQAA